MSGFLVCGALTITICLHTTSKRQVARLPKQAVMLSILLTPAELSRRLSVRFKLSIWLLLVVALVATALLV
jgi:hypothetical protein